LAGPVGPDASTAIDELSSRLDDLETGSGDQAGSSVDDLSSRLDDVESNAEDASTKINDVCDAFLGYSGAFEDILRIRLLSVRSNGVVVGIG
jgi:methyl-accepting chemotaxis protein